MEYLGQHSGRKVYWWEFSEKTLEELPDTNWICFAISDKNPFQNEKINCIRTFVKTCIDKNLLEFKAFGKYSSDLDDFFDIQVVLELEKGMGKDIFIMTTWHDKDSLADAFWQCFYATCLP